MIIYLVQHAKAKAIGEDPKRGISDEGRREIEATARIAGVLGTRPSLIFHSGKKRALETAEVLAEHLNPFIKLTVTDELTPEDDPEIWRDRLKKTHEEVVLVGHLPHLKRLASLLLCGNAEKEIITFKNAAMVALEYTRGEGWSVIWIITPEMDIPRMQPEFELPPETKT